MSFCRVQKGEREATTARVIESLAGAQLPAPQMLPIAQLGSDLAWFTVTQLLVPK